MSKRENIHEPGTGIWFISSSEFTKWRDGQIRSLWLQGIPGAVKTILCSTIIDEIERFCATQSEYCFAYFYFDFSDKKKQIVDSFLRSMMAQLLLNCQDIPHDVQSFYDSYKRNQPSLDDLFKVLLSLLKTFSRTYILIDALDECCEREEMINHLKYLTRSSDLMNLFITCQKEQDVIMELQSDVEIVKRIPNAKIDADVELYVCKHLDKDLSLKRCLPVRGEVIKALVEGSNGMYIPALILANQGWQ
jgi:ankyrin repeat domain-containing protein 50